MDEYSGPPSARWWGDADPVLRAEDLVTALPEVPEEVPAPRRKDSLTRGVSVATVTVLVAIAGTSALGLTNKVETSRSAAEGPGDAAIIADPTEKPIPAPEPASAQLPPATSPSAEPAADSAPNTTARSVPRATPSPRIQVPLFTPAPPLPVEAAPAPAPAPAPATQPAPAAPALPKSSTNKVSEGSKKPAAAPAVDSQKSARDSAREQAEANGRVAAAAAEKARQDFKDNLEELLRPGHGHPHGHGHR